MAALTLHWETPKFYTDGRVEKATLRAASKAGGDALRAMRTESSRIVRGRKRVKLGKLREELTVRFPRGRGVEALEWRLNVASEATPVIDFPARQPRSGVMVGINTGRNALIAGAFIATMRSGHRGVFVREERSAKGFEVTKKAGKRGRAHRVGRLPIRELFTSRVTDVFDDSGVIPAVFTRASETFNASFSRLLPLELAKLE